MSCVIPHSADRQCASILTFQNLKYLSSKLYTLMKALSMNDISAMKVSVIQLKKCVHNFKNVLCHTAFSRQTICINFDIPKSEIFN